jgi:hypothetical protein
VDLLPRDTDLNCVGDWVVESVVRKKLKWDLFPLFCNCFIKSLPNWYFVVSLSVCSVLSVHLTSSKSLVGITGVISEIQQEKKVSPLSTYYCLSILVGCWLLVRILTTFSLFLIRPEMCIYW